MCLSLLLVELGEKLRISHCTGWDFGSTNVAFPFTCFDRLNCHSRKDLEVIPWIFWCCKALYFRGARRTVNDNHPINLFSSLANASDFSRSSVHRVFIFSTFCCDRLSVLFCEFTNTPRNSKVDGGFNVNFWVLIRNSKLRSRNFNESWAISSSSQEAAIKSIPSRYVIILMHSFNNKDIGTFINFVKTLRPKESPKHRHKHLHSRSFYWNLTYFWEFLRMKPQYMRLLYQSCK